MNARNDIEIPDNLLCPLSGKLLVDAVILPDNKVVDRAFITEWINKKHTNPFTTLPLAESDLKADVATIAKAKEFLKKHESTDKYVNKKKEPVNVSYVDKTWFGATVIRSEGEVMLKNITVKNGGLGLFAGGVVIDGLKCDGDLVIGGSDQTPEAQKTKR